MSTIEPSFNSIPSTIQIVLISVFQDIDFPQYSLTAHKNDLILPSIFFYLLFLVFNTFAMQFFLAIIVFPFASLRRKYQVCLEAIEQYEKGSNISAVTLFINLVTFRLVEVKNVSPEDQAKQYKDMSDDIDNTKTNKDGSARNAQSSRIYRQMKAEASLKPTNSKVGRKSIVSINGFQQLAKNAVKKMREMSKPDKSNLVKGWNKNKMFEILKGNYDIIMGRGTGASQIVSRDTYINKMEAIVAYFSRKRQHSLDKKVAEVTTGVFSNLLSSCLYFIYIVIFMSMLTFQLENTNTFKSSQAFSNYISSQKFSYAKYNDQISFTEISTFNEYRAWIDSVVYIKS